MIDITVLHPTARVPRRSIQRLIPAIIRKESRRTLDSVHIIILTDRRIRTLNRRFLDHDAITDVITFDLSERPAAPIDGEIYISFDRARVQARRFHVSIDNEILRLVAHGVLHLLGYDDATESERQTMLERGERYLLKRSA